MGKIAQLQLYFSPSTAKMAKMRIVKNINYTQKYNTGLGLREIDSIKCGKNRTLKAWQLILISDKIYIARPPSEEYDIVSSRPWPRTAGSLDCFRAFLTLHVKCWTLSQY